MKLDLLGTALVLAQFATPVSAASEMKRRDVRVSIADLDLATRKGVIAFEQRLARAVVKACGTAYYLNAEKLRDMDRCRADARNRARVTFKAVLTRKLGSEAVRLPGYD